MPSMLGLTTDPSPHGLSGKNQERQKQNGGGELVPRGDTSITPGLDNNFFAGNQRHNDDSDDEENLKTIAGRNHAAAKEVETLIWRALCDKPKSALKYIAKDAIMSNYLLFDDPEVRSAESDPPLEEELKHCQKWLAYKMHDPQVVEIDLMAVAIAYKVTLFRTLDEGGEGGMQSVNATVSSSWRQEASGDWKLCSMMVA